MDKHSKYSPSSAFRWMLCKASLKYKDLSGLENIFTKNGIEAHTLLVDKKKYMECEDKSMIYGARMFFNYVNKLNFMKDYKVYQEQLVSHGIYKEVYGTVDYLAFDNKELHVVDYKYGFNKIEVENNKQLMLYGLCSLYTFDLFKIKDIYLHIIQPRINYYGVQKLNMEDMMSFNKELKESLLKSEDDYNPGYKQCHYCPALKNKSCNKYIDYIFKKTYKIKTKKENKK